MNSASTYTREVSGSPKIAGETVPRRSAVLEAGEPLLSSLDGIETLHDVFVHGKNSQTADTDDGFIGHRPIVNGVAGDYKWQSYQQAFERIIRFGSGLNEYAKLPNKAAVGIYSLNRPEWVITEHSCYRYGHITVPLYATLGHEALEYIVDQTKMTVVVATADKVDSLVKIGGHIETVVVMDGVEALSQEQSRSFNVRDGVGSAVTSDGRQINIISFRSVEKLGSNDAQPQEPVTGKHIATICYTSGTTGLPKGVVLNHNAFIGVIAATLRLISAGKFYPLQHDDVHISYLPLAHVFERIVQQFLIYKGAKIGFFQGDPLKLLDDMQVLRPTVFVSVPRLLNRVRDKILAGVKAKGVVASTLFNTAYETKRASLQFGYLNSWVWDPIIFNNIKAKLGGRVRGIITGSAPIAPVVLDFLRICFSAHVYEGYGQTETVGASVVTMTDEVEGGIVGAPLPCCEIKLVDVPDMNYYTTDKPFPRGEVYIRGSVFNEYYRDPSKTAETLTPDGWVKTGDVGLWDARGRLKIIDRAKQIFKLSQGEYVAPEKVEAELRLHTDLTQTIFVHGDSLESCIVGVIVPDPETFVPWARDLVHDKEASLEDLCLDKQVNRSLLRELQESGRKAGLCGFEIVRAIHIEPEPFSVENGLLTPTFKTKRHEVLQKYKPVISDMYSSLK